MQKSTRPGRPPTWGEHEERYGMPIRELLKKLYAKHGNGRLVAEELGVRHNTVSSWIMRLKLRVTHILVDADE